MITIIEILVYIFTLFNKHLYSANYDTIKALF